MISTTAQYALRAVVFLAKHQTNYVSRSEIAEGTLVPHDYLLKVLNALDAAGLVESRRGPGGGYQLTSPAKRISTLDVVLAIDEIPRISECPLGITDHEQLCPLHALMDDASRKVEEAFKEVTIDDLISSKRRKRSCHFPDNVS